MAKQKILRSEKEVLQTQIRKEDTDVFSKVHVLQPAIKQEYILHTYNTGKQSFTEGANVIQQSK